VSSAGIEKLFSEAGMLLTKQQKRMSPKLMKKLVYIRYEKKYRKWKERLWISISEEELKKKRKLKRMKLMGTKMKYRMKIWLITK